MGMSKCYSLMKCLLILLNIVFLCVGVLVCAFAVWALCEGVGGGEARGAAEARAGLAAAGGWGAALAGGAAAGLAGAGRGAPSLLAGSFALLALCAVAEGAAAWWGAAHTPQLRAALQDRLLHTMQHEYGQLTTATQIVDSIQLGLECCGADGARDWQTSEWSRALQGSEGGALDDAPAPPAAHADTLDLSVGAPAPYYYVPASCCASSDETECSLATRVPAASGWGAGLRHAACGARVLATLERGARLPLIVCAALLAAHAIALLLTLALCLRAPHHHRYKA